MSLYISSIDTAAFNAKMSVFEPEFKEDIEGTHLENHQDDPGNTYVRVDDVNIKSALESTPESQFRLKIVHPKIKGGEGVNFRYKRRNVKDFTSNAALYNDDEYNNEIDTFPASAPPKSSIIDPAIPKYNMSTYKKPTPPQGEENVSYLYVDDPSFEPTYKQYIFQRYTNISTFANITSASARSLVVKPAENYNCNIYFTPVGSSNTQTLNTDFFYIKDNTVGINALSGYLSSDQFAFYTTILPTGVSAPTEGSFVWNYQPPGFPVPIDIYYMSTAINGKNSVFFYKANPDTWTVVENSNVTSYEFTSFNPIEVGTQVKHLDTYYTIIYGAQRQIKVPSGGYNPEDLSVKIIKSSNVNKVTAICAPRPGDNVMDPKYISTGCIYPPTNSKLMFRDTLIDIQEFNNVLPVYGYSIYNEVYKGFSVSEAIFIIIPEKQQTGDYVEILSESQPLKDGTSTITSNFTAANTLATYGASNTTTTLADGNGNVLPSNLNILVITQENTTNDFNNIGDREPIFYTGEEFKDGGIVMNAMGSVGTNKISFSTSELGAELSGWNFNSVFPTSQTNTTLEFFRSETANPSKSDSSTYASEGFYFTDFNGKIIRYFKRVTAWNSLTQKELDPFNRLDVRALIHGVIVLPGKPYTLMTITNPAQKIIYKTLTSRPKTYIIHRNDSRLTEALNNNFNFDSYANPNQLLYSGRPKLFAKKNHSYYRYLSNESDKYFRASIPRMLILIGNTEIDLATMLGNDYTDNDLFYFSFDTQDVIYSSQKTEPVEPVLIGQFKRKELDTNMTYRFVLEYRNKSLAGWKKITDSDTVDFSSQFNTLSVDNGNQDFYDVRTLVSDQLDFTEATAYTFTTQKNGGSTANPLLAADTYINFMGSEYLINDYNSITNSILKTDVLSQLTTINVENNGGIDAIVIVFPEQNLKNRINYVMDNELIATSKKYEKTYKMIIGFGNIDSKKLYFSDALFNASGSPDITFHGTTFNNSNTNTMQISDFTLVPVLNNTISEYNSVNASNTITAADLDLLILILPKYRKEQKKLAAVDPNPMFALKSKIKVINSIDDSNIPITTAPVVYAPTGSSLIGKKVDLSNVYGLTPAQKANLFTAADISGNTFTSSTFGNADYILVMGSNYIDPGLDPNYPINNSNPYHILSYDDNISGYFTNIDGTANIKFMPQTGVAATQKPIVYCNLPSAEGLWIDSSYIPGIIQNDPSLPRFLEIKYSATISFVASDQLLIAVGSNYLNQLTTISETTVYKVPLLKNARVGVIEIDASYDPNATGGMGGGTGAEKISFYHKYGKNPISLYYDENILGGYNVTTDFTAWPVNPSQRYIRSSTSPTNTELASMQTYFTNSIFDSGDLIGYSNYINGNDDSINTPVDYILVLQANTLGQGTRSSIQELPVFYNTKNIFVNQGDMPTNKALKNPNITTPAIILDKNDTSVVTTAVSDTNFLVEGRNYENDAYDIYLFTEAADSTAFSYAFVDDNVKIVSASGEIDVIRHMKNKRSATSVNKDGTVKLRLFPRTPVFLFTDLKWNSASITKVVINGVQYSIDKNLYNRSEFKFSRDGKTSNKITLFYYTLQTPEPDATKELVIKIETGGSIKDLHINDIFVIQEPPDPSKNIYSITIPA